MEQLKVNTIEFVKLDDVTPHLENVDCNETGEATFEWLEENGDEIYAIRHADTVVGLAIIVDDVEGFLYVYVFPAYRNKGYGKLVVDAAEQRMRDASAETVHTLWLNGDEHVMRFAERYGYKRTHASAFMAYRGEPFPEEDLPIRHFQDEDYPEAFSLYAEAFHAMRLSTGWHPDSVVAQPSEASRKQWAEDAQNEYVYVLGDEIVGHAWIDGTELDVVSIKIPHQGKGLGRKFVKYLTNRILEKGEGEPTLWCVIGNNKARVLYDSLGFEEICRNDFAVKKFSE